MTSPPPKLDATELMDQFRRHMRDHNLPVTQQREAIAAVLFHSNEHLSVEDIEGVLRSRGVHVGKATVYRTLDLLDRAGLVVEHDFGEGFKRYEPQGATNHHEHLVCVECGITADLAFQVIIWWTDVVVSDARLRRNRCE